MKHVIGRLIVFYTRDINHFIIGVAINAIQILTIALALSGYHVQEPGAKIVICLLSFFLMVMYNIRNYTLANNSIKEYEEEYEKKYPISFFNIDLNTRWEKEQD